MQDMLDFFYSIIKGFAGAWSWLTTPINLGSLNDIAPAWLTTPLALISFAGITAVLVFKIIRMILGAIPVA